jgi:hypothetical protein
MPVISLRRAAYVDEILRVGLPAHWHRHGWVAEPETRSLYWKMGGA